MSLPVKALTLDRSLRRQLFNEATEMPNSAAVATLLRPRLSWASKIASRSSALRRAFFISFSLQKSLHQATSWQDLTVTKQARIDARS
jgi:hypothetical protein